MFTSLRIKNFKAWEDTGALRLAPLTIFFGPNSSGKSSLHQFLLMLKQTAESPDRNRVLFPGDKNSPIDLGLFIDLFHGHRYGFIMHFELQWTLNQRLRFKDPLNGKFFSGDKLSFSADIATDNPDRDPFVNLMLYEMGNGGEKALQTGMKLIDRSSMKYEMVYEKYLLTRKPGRAWPLPKPIKFYAFPDEVTAYFQNADYVRDLTLALEKKLGLLYYLGPLRDFPQRAYLWSGEVPEHVGYRGERAIEAILASKSRELKAGGKKKYRAFEIVIAGWLKWMGLLEGFEVKRIGRRRDYEVLVKSPGAQSWVNLPDVGFGVSQVLPVLTQCFFAPPGSTIILEQPEIHLHPSVQASLADLFIEAINSKEQGQDRGVQLLVESHSEHLLHRLQRRIAEEKVSPDQVAIYFCSQAPSRIEPLKLDLYGNITNYPDKFFGDMIGDLAAMTEAGLNRKIRARA